MPTAQPAAAGIPADGKTALTNVRVFDGIGLQPPGTVVIDCGLIGADAGGARIIDGHGGVLLPGLIDAHVHLSGAGSLEQLSAFGITTALDMGTWPAELVDSLRGRAGLTDIRSTGVGATSPASRHGQLPGRPAEGFVSGPGEASGYVAGRVREGADYIKIIIDLPGFDLPTVSALVSAAHEHGKLAITHASARAAVAMAQQAEADVVTHAPLDQPLDEDAAAVMLAGRRIIVPTLAMMEAICVKLGALQPAGTGPGRSYAASRDSVSVLYRAGVPVLAGTDANNTPGVPASPPFGDSLHHELELLTGAGLSAVDALRAATVLPARYFGLADRGVIEPGRRADLVLVAGDPVADIRATRQIERVWCAGFERLPA
jgi:imidazolonepropionase-like amidohydrolase